MLELTKGYDASGKKRASSLSTRDQEILEAIYTYKPLRSETRFENSFVQRSVLWKTDKLADESGLISKIALQQSKLNRLDKLYSLDIAINVDGTKWWALRIYAPTIELLTQKRIRQITHIMRNVLISILVFWGQRFTSELHGFSGDLVSKNIAGEESSIRGRHQVNKILNEEMKKTLNQTAVDIKRYQNLEKKLFSAKPYVEKLILHAVLLDYLSQNPFEIGKMTNVEDNVINLLSSSLAPLKVYRESKTQVQEANIGPMLNPLLVSFWVPSREERKINTDHKNKSSVISYCFTRDQLAFCIGVGGRASFSRDRHREDIQELLSHKLLSYNKVLFDGIASYVFETQAPYFTDDAYGDPRVSFDDFDSSSKSDRTSEDQENKILDFYKSRVVDRDRLSDLEQLYWGTSKQGALVAPILSRSGVAAVLQIQTPNDDLLKSLCRTDFCNALSLLNLQLDKSFL